MKIKPVPLFGDPGEAEKLAVALAKGRPVLILIHSFGGDMDAAMGMADLIVARRPDTIGVALGNCMSAATIIWAVCDKRYVTSAATLMFHRSSVTFEDKDYREIKRYMRLCKEADERWNRLMAESLGVKLSTVKRWGHPASGNTYVGADEVIRRGWAKPWKGKVR